MSEPHVTLSVAAEIVAPPPGVIVSVRGTANVTVPGEHPPIVIVDRLVTRARRRAACDPSRYSCSGPLPWSASVPPIAADVGQRELPEVLASVPPSASCEVALVNVPVIVPV